MTNTSKARTKNVDALKTNRRSVRAREAVRGKALYSPRRTVRSRRNLKRTPMRSKSRVRPTKRSRSRRNKTRRSRSRRNKTRLSRRNKTRRSRSRRNKTRRSRSRKTSRARDKRRVSSRRGKSNITHGGLPSELHVTIPDNLMNSEAIIPVELEIDSAKYYYPVVPARPNISGVNFVDGNKAIVKVDPHLICDTEHMATIVVPAKYDGAIKNESIVPFHKPESDTDTEHDDKIYALKLRENEKGGGSPPLTIIVFEDKQGNWVRLDSEGAKLSPNNYIAAELTEKDYKQGKVELTADNNEKITVPVKGKPPKEGEPPAIITVTRPPEKEDEPWTASDVTIAVALGGLAAGLLYLTLPHEVIGFVKKTVSGGYGWLKNKFKRSGEKKAGKAVASDAEKLNEEVRTAKPPRDAPATKPSRSLSAEDGTSPASLDDAAGTGRDPIPRSDGATAEGVSPTGSATIAPEKDAPRADDALREPTPPESPPPKAAPPPEPKPSPPEPTPSPPETTKPPPPETTKPPPPETPKPPPPEPRPPPPEPPRPSDDALREPDPPESPRPSDDALREPDPTEPPRPTDDALREPNPSEHVNPNDSPIDAPAQEPLQTDSIATKAADPAADAKKFNALVDEQSDKVANQILDQTGGQVARTAAEEADNAKAAELIGHLVGVP